MGQRPRLRLAPRASASHEVPSPAAIARLAGNSVQGLAARLAGPLRQHIQPPPKQPPPRQPPDGQPASYAVVSTVPAPSSPALLASLMVLASTAPGGHSSSSSSSSSDARNHSAAVAGPSAGASAGLRFAKHLAQACNAASPVPARFESLGLLLFDARRLQDSLAGSRAASPGAWLAHGDAGLAALEQVYLTGQALAELGSADALGAGNAARAAVSLDYARLLQAYLGQHGPLLAEPFWAALPCDELQAKAIHVAGALQTRCTVHAAVFERLLGAVGSEQGAAPGAAPGGSGAAAWGGGQPIIVNTVCATASPQLQQAVRAGAASSGGSSSSSSNVAGAGGPGWAAQLWAVVMLVFGLAGRCIQVAAWLVVAVKHLCVQLLMLRAVAAGVQAARSVAAPAAASRLQAASAPAAGAAAQPWALAAALPVAAAVQPAQRAAGRPAPLAVASCSAAAGALGLLAASPLAPRQPRCKQQQEQQQAVPAAALLQSMLAGARAKQQQLRTRLQDQAARTDSRLLYALWAPEAARQSAAGHVGGPAAADGDWLGERPAHAWAEDW